MSGFLGFVFEWVVLYLTLVNLQVLLVPSAFTKVTGQAHWEILLRARAIETQCYVCSIFTSSRKFWMKICSKIKFIDKLFLSAISSLTASYGELFAECIIRL